MFSSLLSSSRLPISLRKNHYVNFLLNRRVTKFKVLITLTILNFILFTSFSVHWIPIPNFWDDSWKNVTRFVNPLIGTDKGPGSREYGHVFPGACHPYGVVKLGFDTDNKLEFNAGYTPSGNITGISHLHVSGTGGEPKYGVISQFPVIDSPESPLDLNSFSSERSFEHFEVGYSKFGLKRYNIVVELTASRRTGLHRYTFPPTENDAKIILDIPHNLIVQNYGFTHQYHGGSIESISVNEIKGAGRYSGGWNRGGPYIVYFCSQFNTNATGFKKWDGGGYYQGFHHFDDVKEDFSRSVGGGILTFNTTENPVIISRVGISFISTDQACKSAESEIPDWDFENTKQEAINAWQTELEKIFVEGETDEFKTIFYSSLYRTMIIPSNRTTNPLFTLFQQERAIDITRSLIDIYKNEGFMPDGRSGLSNGITQGGSNADMVVAEAYLKKLGTGIIDWDLAYEALIKDAEIDPQGRGLYEGRLSLSNYKKYGYIPFRGSLISTYAYSPCSRTIEYSANDYSIGLVAKEMGKYDDYIKYKNRARSWENLWYPNLTFDGAKGFIVPRYEDGNYYTSMDVLREAGGEYVFYEGSSWEYSLDIPFDVKRLIELSGGPEFFEERLDKTFSDKSYINGYYNIGNEPDFFHICLYHFIGKQYKSVEVIRDILKTKFGSGQNGVPGNDDSGAMGSWFAFNAIGLYPLAGTDIYLINSPHFDKVTISLSQKLKFKIIAYNLKTENHTNPYVQSVKINGKYWRKTWFRHSDIANGAVMELNMGPNPSEVWGIVRENENQVDVEDRIMPPSMSDYDD
ncbi:glycoside hydrolase family 92 protein [Gigaspora margarita]|uniref:Glycoside hydrolase family 92 protein n=1 Tax=Gigaspora margarita TaxID=4874 RepID=A0A8H4ES38_GIGMA|nr:glycoside hydrolase family 92 protein [Gigaspora margarita]